MNQTILQLNKQQLQAIQEVTKPVLVIAGAGSGKTRVITQKIIHLVARHKLALNNIFALTFTNKAANEMKSRVTAMLPDKTAKANISTFHRLGLDIIKQTPELLGLRTGFSIFDNKDSEKVIAEISAGMLDKERVILVQRQISNWKNAGFSPYKPIPNINTAEWELFKKYEEALALYNAVDFDDLLLRPLSLLQNNQKVRSSWQDKIRYLLIDEYQDTNIVQYELLKILTHGRDNLTVVGDDDQSIYAWRGADKENLSRLESDFTNLCVIKLEQNYRSCGRILKAANLLIDNNPHLYKKSLWSALGFGDSIKVFRCNNEIHEAEKVVANTSYRKVAHNAKFSDFAILYRGNYQARLFELALREHNIPYKISGGRSFFDYTEIKDMLAYLKIMVNPADDAALLRIINTPRRGIGQASLQALAQLAQKNSSCLSEAGHDLTLQDILTSRSYKNVTEFFQWLLKKQDEASRTPPIEFVTQLIKEIGYEEWLFDRSETEEIAERRLKNITSLTEWIKNIKRDKLSDVVSHISLMDILENNKQEEETNAVQLMTLHAAKGLEFAHVYLVGMEEGLLPHKNSIDNALEEERRLAYVGITRARTTLTMSYALKRKTYGQYEMTEPSRFINELPQEDIDFSGVGIAVDKKQQKAVNQHFLAQLKELQL